MAAACGAWPVQAACGARPLWATYRRTAATAAARSCSTRCCRPPLQVRGVGVGGGGGCRGGDRQRALAAVVSAALLRGGDSQEVGKGWGRALRSPRSHLTAPCLHLTHVPQTRMRRLRRPAMAIRPSPPATTRRGSWRGSAAGLGAPLTPKWTACRQPWMTFRCVGGCERGGVWLDNVCCRQPCATSSRQAEWCRPGSGMVSGMQFGCLCGRWRACLGGCPAA